MDSVDNVKAYGLLSVLQRGGLSMKAIASRAGVALATLSPFRVSSDRRMAMATYMKLFNLYREVRSEPEFQAAIDAWKVSMEAKEKFAAADTAEQEDSPAPQTEPQPEAEKSPAPMPVVEKAPAPQAAPDLVNHPSHYERVAVKVEPMHLTAHLPHPLASSFEYLIRAGFKDGQSEATDLRKARVWLKYWLDDKESTGFKVTRIDFARAVIFDTGHVFVGHLLEPIISAMRHIGRSCMDFPFTVTREEMAVGVKKTIEAVEKRLNELEQPS